MSNVIQLKAMQAIKKARLEDKDYEFRVKIMDKVDLLEEMVRFQEERTRIGQLTLPMMIRGKILFKALSEHAETHALRSLAQSYSRHLHYEMEAYLTEGQVPAEN